MSLEEEAQETKKEKQKLFPSMFQLILNDDEDNECLRMTLMG